MLESLRRVQCLCILFLWIEPWVVFLLFISELLLLSILTLPLLTSTFSSAVTSLGWKFFYLQWLILFWFFVIIISFLAFKIFVLWSVLRFFISFLDAWFYLNFRLLLLLITTWLWILKHLFKMLMPSNDQIISQEIN